MILTPNNKSNRVQQITLTLCQTVASEAGWNGVDLQELGQEVAEVEVGVQEGGVSPQVVVDAAQMEVVGEGVHVDQVLVLLALVHEHQLHL